VAGVQAHRAAQLRQPVKVTPVVQGQLQAAAVEAARVPLVRLLQAILVAQAVQGRRHL
jgi:hypothetical protein